MIQVARFILGGVHGHRNRRQIRIRLDARQRSQAIHTRHGVIHENAIGLLAAQIFQGLFR